MAEVDGVSRTVPVRIYLDDAREQPTEVAVPADAFEMRDGRPVGLVGPRVRIDVGGEISVAQSTLPRLRRIPVIGQYAAAMMADRVTQTSRVVPNQADRDGGFRDPALDLAQNTAFVAANQTITLAERMAGRRIDWGDDGRLTVRPHAFVASGGLDLNAFFMPSEQRVSLGALGTVRDGIPVPLDGTGFAFIERAVERQRQAVAAVTRRADATPAEREEANRRTDVLAAVVAAARRDDPREVQRLVDAEIARLAPAPAAAAPSLFDQIRSATADAWQTVQDMGRMPEEARARMYYLTDLERLRDDIQKARPLPGRLVQLANDRFIAAHESGHAVLYALMPALQTHAGATLHEAYGDTVSILTALQSDELVRRMITETGGDFTRSNSVSRIGEELTLTRREATRDTSDDQHTALRDVANRLRVADFPGVQADQSERLTLEAKNGPHAVSQVVSGALYEHLARRAISARSAGADGATALRGAGDELGLILHRSTLFLPENGGSLHDVGAALVQSARRFASPDAALQLESILRERGILGAEVPSSMRDVPDVTLQGLDAAIAGGVLRSVRWTQGEGVRVTERVTDDRGWTRVRYGKPFNDQGVMETVGSFVFDPTGRLVAYSAATL